jgi:hypothetical protein
MNMLKELGITDLGDNLRGITNSTNMHHNNFKISCGNPEADQMLANSNDSPREEVKMDEEEENTLGYARVVHNYLQQEIIIPTLEPYRTKEIDYGDEFDSAKTNRFLTYEEKKNSL